MAGIDDILKLREQALLGQGMPAGIGTPYAAPPPNPMDTGGIQQPQPSFAATIPPPQSTIPRIGEPTPPPVQQESDIERLIRMYTPETAATKRFEELMAAQPKYENPSLGRKLVATGVGLKGGIDTMDKVLDQPFNRSTEMWKSKVEPAYQAANLERYANANERALMGNLLTNQTAEKRIAVQAESARIRDLATQYKALGWEIEKAGDRLVAVRPPNPRIPGDKGEYKDLGPSGMMDQQQLEAFRATNRLDVAELIGNMIFNTGPNTPPVVINPRGDPNQPATPVQGVTGPVTRPPTTPEALLQGVAPNTLEKIRQSARETLETVNLIIDDKGNLYPAVKDIVGGSRLNPFSGGSRIIPGSAASTAQINYDNLKARQIIDLIEEMKAQSRTGATGFGQLTGKELEVLQAAASRLNVASDEATFQREMKLIKEKLLLILAPGPGEGNTAATPTDPNLTDVQRRAAEILRQKDPRLVTPANIDAFIKANGLQ